MENKLLNLLVFSLFIVCVDDECDKLVASLSKVGMEMKMPVSSTSTVLRPSNCRKATSLDSTVDSASLFSINILTSDEAL